MESLPDFTDFSGFDLWWRGRGRECMVACAEAFVRPLHENPCEVAKQARMVAKRVPGIVKEELSVFAVRDGDEQLSRLKSITQRECFLIWWNAYGRAKAEQIAQYYGEEKDAEDIASEVVGRYLRQFDAGSYSEKSLRDLTRQLATIVRNLIRDRSRLASERTLEGDALVHPDSSMTLLETVPDPRPEHDPHEHASYRLLLRKINRILSEGIAQERLSEAEVGTWRSIRITGEDQRAQMERYGWKSPSKVTQVCDKVERHIQVGLDLADGDRGGEK